MLKFSWKEDRLRVNGLMELRNLLLMLLLLLMQYQISIFCLSDRRVVVLYNGKNLYSKIPWWCTRASNCIRVTIWCCWNSSVPPYGAARPVGGTIVLLLIWWNGRRVNIPSFSLYILRINAFIYCILFGWMEDRLWWAWLLLGETRARLLGWSVNAKYVKRKKRRKKKASQGLK